MQKRARIAPESPIPDSRILGLTRGIGFAGMPVSIKIADGPADIFNSRFLLTS